MQSTEKSVVLFADLAPAHQEAIQKGVGYDGTSYHLKDGTVITIVAEGYEVVSPASEVIIPGVLEAVADGIVPAPENDLEKAPLVPAAEVIAATGGENEAVADAAATGEVVPEANTEVTADSNNEAAETKSVVDVVAPEQSTEGAQTGNVA